MFELKQFQVDAAKLMADRFAFFVGHPDRPMKGPTKPRPFFQALSAITGAGKTPILAEAVSQICLFCDPQPIVFWMSKAKSVVAQTFTNFDSGKYRELVEGFRVINVPALTPQLISDGSTPLLVLATTGLFNNKEQSDGSLNIYKTDNDQFGEKSPWDRLKERNHGKRRRPLIIVYDEGHNLSDQQSEILAELEPDAYLLASATLKLPLTFQKGVLQHIRSWVDEAGDAKPFATLKAVNEDGQPESELFITTIVQSEKVVAAELVKKAIQFDGTTAAMERSLDDLFTRRAILEKELAALGVKLEPKAIYVCKTNITDDGEKDDDSKPFNQRKAPPIRIWRYLVEEKGIDPEDIAIYANLDFGDGNKPDELRLFSKGENDFDDFRQGDFKHIIFNLALQEGWDDPACYLAYIDKSMGSSIQVEQIIGRVLRQYDATHYDSPLLNSAHFFIRVDNQNTFSDAITKVTQKLKSEGAPIEIASSFGTGKAGADDLEPKHDVVLHHVFADADGAREEIARIVKKFPTYTEGDADTLGQAHTATQVVQLENLGAQSAVEWKADGNTNLVRLRWLVSTAIKKRSARALAVTDLKGAKFDVRVQIQSNADQMTQDLARDVVGAYYAQTELVYESEKPFQFGTIRVPKSAVEFQHGLYERYSGFNKFERAFADALDPAVEIWHRNPSSGGFHIPLLSEGDTAHFYPDFIVWHKNKVFCIDTKGSHLLADAAAHKLFDIREDDKTRIHVRFVSEGKQDKLRGKPIPGGFTVWRQKNGVPTPVQVDSMAKAVAECLKA